MGVGPRRETGTVACGWGGEMVEGGFPICIPHVECLPVAAKVNFIKCCGGQSPRHWGQEDTSSGSPSPQSCNEGKGWADVGLDLSTDVPCCGQRDSAADPLMPTGGREPFSTETTSHSPYPHPESRTAVGIGGVEGYGSQ